MSYIEVLYFFIFRPEHLKGVCYPAMELVYMGNSAIIGLIMICLDYTYYLLANRSLLHLPYHSLKRHWLIFLVWPLMSALTCCLCICKGIIMTNTSCFLCGIAWPIVIGVLNYLHRSQVPPNI